MRTAIRVERREFITRLGGIAAGWPALTTGLLLPAAAFAQGTGRWTSGTPMPSARTEIAVGEVIGKIYVVGGFRGDRELEIYDPAADLWSRGAAIPRPLHHAAAVGLNGKLYVIGGFVEGWTPTGEVHEYDPASDRWQRLAALPTTRGALAAAVFDGKIHAVGGIGWRGRNTPAHEVYDPAANQWTALANVNVCLAKRRHLMGVDFSRALLRGYARNRAPLIGRGRGRGARASSALIAANSFSMARADGAPSVSFRRVVSASSWQTNS
jgi:N-acetylneuraminic acid mutarotase